MLSYLKHGFSVGHFMSCDRRSVLLHTRGITGTVSEKFVWARGSVYLKINAINYRLQLWKYEGTYGSFKV